jgi:hypothetical protein
LVDSARRRYLPDFLPLTNASQGIFSDRLKSCFGLENLVVGIGALTPKFGGGVCNFNLLENCGAIIDNIDFADFEIKHLVQTLGAKGGLDDVGKSSHCLKMRQLELRV